jgi:hypothetical protein
MRGSPTSHCSGLAISGLLINDGNSSPLNSSVGLLRYANHSQAIGILAHAYAPRYSLGGLSVTFDSEHNLVSLSPRDHAAGFQLRAAQQAIAPDSQ